MKPFDVEKQFRFALASALTLTAKEAQREVLSEIGDTFTLRNTWARPSNAMGIKVLPASKFDLSAAIVTRADWLIPHELGEDKVPSGEHLAVPTRNVRRTKRDIIQRSQRPGALRGKRDVILKLKDGTPMLFQRRGRKGATKLVPLYRLIRRARIERQSTVVVPVERIAGRRFEPLLWQQLRRAISTAR